MLKPKLHHVTIKTSRLDQMIAWYGQVIGAEVNFRDGVAAWTTNDDANHRIAFLAVPGLRDDGEKVSHNGMHHCAFEYDSFADLMASFDRLRRHGIEPGVLAVCRPSDDPSELVTHFVQDLGLKHFDVLVPDATHDDRPKTIAPYYKRLFDIWYDGHAGRGVDVRYVHAILKGVLGGNSHLESIGYGPIQTCAMMTDGALEPLDVLRIAGYQTTRTEVSILTHTFQDVTADPLWRRAFEQASNLCDTCKSCEYRLACGGGFLPHRWSTERGYDNPSVYCDDLKDIFGHVWQRVAPAIRVTTDQQRLQLDQAAAEVAASA